MKAWEWDEIPEHKSKEYFVEWVLLTNEEIEPGDSAVDKVVAPDHVLVFEGGTLWRNSQGELVNLPQWQTRFAFKKVMLCLCSMAVNLYDEVYNPVTDEFETVIKDLYEGGGPRPDNCTDFQEVAQCGSFKVIGKVSPEATWVQKGDEFDFEEIHIWEHWKDGTRQDTIVKVRNADGKFY